MNLLPKQGLQVAWLPHFTSSSDPSHHKQQPCLWLGRLMCRRAAPSMQAALGCSSTILGHAVHVPAVKTQGVQVG